MPSLRLVDDGIEIDVSAPHADEVMFCTFDEDGNETRHQMERQANGTHHGLVAGVTTGTRYGLRTVGPWDPDAGLFHHPALLLLDPDARAVSGSFQDRPSFHIEGPREDTAPWAPRGVITQTPPRPRPGPGTAWSDTVVYETHVRGLTMRHPQVDPRLRGTYLGACAPPVIEHLLRLGVTAIELMPVAHHVTEPFLQKRGLVNYWGYSTLGWFAPHAGYATAHDGRQLEEFSRMVDTFHSADIEVIVDVVFNHTAEGGREGPILGMKGLGNSEWYRFDDGGYVDWTGTGNTVDTSNRRVRSAILDALHWWSDALGVDGFRFDLAVTLGRDPDHFETENLAWLVDDPGLAHCKLIAEPWDLGPDGYRVGAFGPRFAEWNDRFRDDMRDFWRGHVRPLDVADRLSGSADRFGDRPTWSSVNLITAHDGFTLADLVSYDHKHNGPNGERNRDGHDDNRSWNSGIEGHTTDPEVLETRRRRSSALLTTLLLSVGVPQLVGGDELGRSQAGNNNAYALDNEVTWLDWTRDVHSNLVAAALRCRRRHRCFRGAERPDVEFSVGNGGALGYRVSLDGDEVLIVCNPTPQPVALEPPDAAWSLELDSSAFPDEPDASSPVMGPWTVRVYGRLTPP